MITTPMTNMNSEAPPGAIDAVGLYECDAYRSAKLPIFPGESFRELESRIRQAHQLLEGATRNGRRKAVYTVIQPSPPGPLLLSKRTYSNCSISCKSDRTTGTVLTAGSMSVTSDSDDTATGSYSCNRICDSLIHKEDTMSCMKSTAPPAENLCNANAPDWGYFVDVVDEEDSAPQRKPSYRHFLSKELQCAKNRRPTRCSLCV